MKQLVLLSLIAVICGAAADSRCMWGPSYWCSSLPAAKTCGSLKHCILTVWTHDKPVRKSSQNDVICDYCETFVSDARKFLAEKKTQEEIQQYLDEACSLIPDRSFSSKCQELVKDYLPELIQILESEMEPKAVCALLGLCTGFEDTVHVKQSLHTQTLMTQMATKVNNTYCADCKKFFNDIKEIIQSAKTEKEIEQFIENNYCVIFGELKNLCKELVETYVPQIMSLMAQYVDPSMTCGAMGMCSPGDITLFSRMRLRTSPLYKGLRQMKSNGEECLLCKTVFTELIALDKEKKTQEAVLSFIETNICGHLGSLAEECKFTVKMYGQDLFEVLANVLNPNVACPELGFCSAAQKPVKTAPLKETVAKTVHVHSMKQTPRRNGPSTECVLCEFIMKQLEGILKKNATETEIVSALDKVCDLLPKSLSSECEQFVNTYAPAIIKLLAAEISPDMLCSSLGLCKAKSETTLTFRRAPTASETCDTCQLVMQYVDSLLEQKSTEQEIEKILDKVCNFLPKSYADQCEDIVHQYGPAIVQLIAQFADPREVCTDIGLCSNSSAIATSKDKTSSTGLHNLLGAKKCTFGPTFWCANIVNAKKCNAVAHCQKHVWKN